MNFGCAEGRVYVNHVVWVFNVETQVAMGPKHLHYFLVWCGSSYTRHGTYTGRL